MLSNTNCVGRIQFVNGNSIVAPLTIGNTYEVVAWLKGIGLEALVVDDNGNVYVAINVQDPVQWTVLSL